LEKFVAARPDVHFLVAREYARGTKNAGRRPAMERGGHILLLAGGADGVSTSPRGRRM